MDKWLPLITGIIGALIGSGASVITIYIQSRAQAKRELLQTACTLAFEEYKIFYDHAKTRGNVTIEPLSSSLHYHMSIMKALYDDKLDEEKYRAIYEESRRINKLFDKLAKEENRRS